MIIHNKVAYICIAHEKPLYSLPNYFNLFKTADFNFENFNGCTYSVKEFVDERSEFHPVNNYYPDYSFSHIENILLNDNYEIDFIYLSLHRKFIASKEYGKPSQNFYGMNILNQNINLNEILLADGIKSSYLVSKPLVFSDGVVGQYSRKHILRDFELFTNLLKLSNILTSKEINLFLNQKILIPAVPLGLLPYNIFLKLIKSLSIFIKYTDSKGYQISMPNDSYQCRARSFFLERLSSFLFLKFLGNKCDSFINDISNFGYCITVSPDNVSNIYRGGNI
jgi:hypothetical protein